MNILMTRIYTAQEQGESPILDQIFSLIDQASEDGEVDSNDLKLMKRDDGSINILDKVHNENTLAVPNKETGGIKLVEEDAGPESKDLQVGQLVTWKDTSGNDCTGKIIEINGRLSQVQCEGKIISVSTDLLTQMNSTETKQFTKRGDNMYLLNAKNEIMAYGHEQSLGRLHKEHPDWKMLSQYDFNAFKRKLVKRFSNMSEENQKLFTRQNRRFVILEGNKVLYTVDIDNVKGLLKKNKNWVAMRETEYHKTMQKKFSNLSPSTIKLIQSGSL